MLKAIKHPNIIELLDYYYTYKDNEEYLNLIMELFPMNLDEKIRNEKIVPIQIKRIMNQVLKALAYLEENKIAHRDLKPHNILFNP